MQACRGKQELNNERYLDLFVLTQGSKAMFVVAFGRFLNITNTMSGPFATWNSKLKPQLHRAASNSKKTCLQDYSE